MKRAGRSWTRDFLSLGEKRDIISFAGGLPLPELLPVDAIRRACEGVLCDQGAASLQYASTEGYAPLREWIASRYRAHGLPARAEEILITTGSQQAMDLLGKVLLNPGDLLLMESPAYQGAIQAFNLYEPRFATISPGKDGPDAAELEQLLSREKPAFAYLAPDFQNPSGIRYSERARRQIADTLDRHDVLLVEDDPYGELFFEGERMAHISQYRRAKRPVMLGSFSKIVAPSFRLGWIFAPRGLMSSLVSAKQACDLHTNHFTQMVLYRFLSENDLNTHLGRCRSIYKQQRDAMVESIRGMLEIETIPDGGLFLWGRLAEGMDSVDFLRSAMEEGVAFVPGYAFFTDGAGARYLRLNYSGSSPERIREGARRLGKALERQVQ